MGIRARRFASRIRDLWLAISEWAERKAERWNDRQGRW